MLTAFGCLQTVAPSGCGCDRGLGAVRRSPQQQLCRKACVEWVARPPRDRRLGVDAQAEGAAGTANMLAVAGRGSMAVRDSLAVRSMEGEPAGAGMDGAAPLVEEAVMVAAEEDEVAEVGRTAAGPVHDVVGVDEPPLTAPRKAAAAVAGGERSRDMRWDAPGAAPNVCLLYTSPSPRDRS